MENFAPTPPSSARTTSPPPQRQPSAEAILALVDGALAGIAGVYVSTHSVLVTVIASVAAIVLATKVFVRH